MVRCQAAGLDPRTQPFEFLTLNNKMVLYPKKSCAEQLCHKHQLTVEIVRKELLAEVKCYTVTVRVTRPDGSYVEDEGVVGVAGLQNEGFANAIKRAISQAKRRAIFSATGMECGDLGDIENMEAKPLPQHRQYVRKQVVEAHIDRVIAEAKGTVEQEEDETNA
jgi:hypothetical protein